MNGEAIRRGSRTGADAIASHRPGMHALVCHAYGGPDTLSLERIAVPKPGPDELLVRILGAGMNFADLVVLAGHYQDRVEPPFVPGAEVYGEVCEVGDAVANFAIGDRVMGQVRSGGYAEFARMDPRQTVRLPFDMPETHAAGFFINYGTAYSALVQRARGQAGESVLVFGAAGGVGLAALQIAKALGMRVIADCRGAAKQELVREHGADLIVDHSAPGYRDQIRSFTKGVGCDIIIDVIGGAATRAALHCIGWCGRIVLIGFAGGSPHEIPANHVLVKNCSVIGHWWGDYHWRDRQQLDAAFQHLFHLYKAGRLRPHVSDALPLERVAEGLRRYAARKVLGKLIVIPAAQT